MVRNTGEHRVRRFKTDVEGPIQLPRRGNGEAKPPRQSRLPPVTAAFIDFFRALTHEINQPLTSILSNAQAAQQLMKAAQVDRAEVQAILKDISGQNKRVTETLKELRVLLKHCEIPMDGVSLADVMQDALSLARSDLLAYGIKVGVHFAGDIPSVRAAYMQLRQVLLALIRCTCDTMILDAPHGHYALDITAEILGKAVRISIAGRGSELEAEQCSSELPSFFARPHDELQLGVAVCRLIVAAHEGSLWMTRQLDGNIAFHFTIPILREKKS